MTEKDGTHRITIEVPMVVYQAMFRLAHGNLRSLDSAISAVLFKFMTENIELFASDMQAKIAAFAREIS